jgi:uroporphyrinogen III methyltransferase/synthase
VVFDRLVLPELLDLAPSEALRIDMGKLPGQTGRQSEIHSLLIEHGATKRVVRLKGGDPFVFGRGAEEIEALVAAGVDYEVVPGVTSAFAVPASAGVPVTHRGLSTSVTVVTGHVGDPSAPGGVAWDALARAGGTLVILMGMENRAGIASLLMNAGRSPETPVLVVQWGTTPAERSVRVALDHLHAVELGAPATIVVGPVAGLDLGGRGAGAGAGRGPLSGVSVVVTRPRGQAQELVDRLTETGAHVVCLPTIAIAEPVDPGPLEEAVTGVADYDWVVFTSSNAVDRFVGLLRDGRDLAGVRLAAVGPATAAALADRNLVADLVADVSTAEGLVESIPPPPAGSRGRILFPRAAAARPVLAPGLRAKGWAVDEVEAYRTVAASPPVDGPDTAVERAVAADAIIFTSSSTVAHFLARSGGKRPPVVVCLGPVTAEAARSAGLVVDVVAAEPTADALVAALVQRWESR